MMTFTIDLCFCVVDVNCHRQKTPNEVLLNEGKHCTTVLLVYKKLEHSTSLSALAAAVFAISTIFYPLE